MQNPPGSGGRAGTSVTPGAGGDLITEIYGSPVVLTQDGEGNWVFVSVTALPTPPWRPVLPGARTIFTPPGVITGRLWDWGGAGFNVLAASAAGNGVTNDSAAFQATVNANEAAGGGPIIVPPPQPGQTYLLNQALTGIVNSYFISYSAAAFSGAGAASVTPLFIFAPASLSGPGIVSNPMTSSLVVNSPFTVTAAALIAAGLAGLTNLASGRFVGRWTTAGGGPPAGLTALVGDSGFDVNGVLWYCVAAGTPGTWNAAGANAGAQFAQVLTAQTTASGAFVDLATVGPSITMVTGTRVMVSFACQTSDTAANAVCEAALDVSGATTLAATLGPYCLQLSHAAIGGIEQAGTSFLLTGLTAGSNTFKLKYATNGGTATFSNRILTVTPA